MSCCDVWGNAGGDWVGCLYGQYGTNGNIWADPVFCGPTSGDFTVDGSSPCLPEHSPCGAIGAWPMGCGTLMEVGGDPLSSRHGLLILSRSLFVPPREVAYRVPPATQVQRVRLDIHDVSGRLVRTLVDRVEEAGAHSVVWDGLDQDGRIAPAGVYFLRLAADEHHAGERILVFR